MTDSPASAPVRVLLVGPSLDILGGQSVALSRLRARLEHAPGIAVDFLAVNPRLPGVLAALQRIKYVRTLVTSARYVLSLPGAVRRSDVVHAFSASYWSFLLAPVPAMLVARLLGKPVLLNYHSGEAPDHLARARFLARPFLRLADAIVVPSRFLVVVFGEHGLAARAIPNFIDAQADPPAWPRSPGDAPVLLSNRNFAPLYDVGTTLRVFARVQREIPDARLVVAGAGSQRDHLHALAAELGLRNLEWPGRVEPSRMRALYERADVYVSTPTIDNMPLSVLEAWSAGVPVVSSNAGGVPYLVEDGRTGLLAPPRDVDALAAAVLRVLREPGLGASLAAEAREHLLRSYTWEAVEGAWREAYLGLAGVPVQEVREHPAEPMAAQGSAR